MGLYPSRFVILEEIKRLRAEGERLLEEEQAKYKLAKKQQREVAQVKLYWKNEIKAYSLSELRNVFGTDSIVMSSKKKGVAVAEFERFSPSTLISPF